MKSILLSRVWKEGCVCKLRTQDPENFDEEVKSLVSAWRSFIFGFTIIFTINL